MQGLKNTKSSSKNIQQAFRQIYKYGPLFKQTTDFHKTSQSKENLAQKAKASLNIVEKDTLKRKITCKKHANLRTFNFQDVVSNKIYTQNSSLCASIQKQKKQRNSTINTVSKERLKMSSNFSSFHELSSTKLQHKSISVFCGQSEKKTVKLKTTGSQKQMQNILQRTKSVLDGWIAQKEKWLSQKQQYQAKIKNLTLELDIMKQKITLNDNDIQIKRSHELLIK